MRLPCPTRTTFKKKSAEGKRKGTYGKINLTLNKINY